MNDCLFCKIIAGEIPSETVYENERVLAFLDIHPLNPGHTLVIPKLHAENILASSVEDAEALMRAVKEIAPKILKAVGAEDCNITTNSGKAAGQIIFHTHLHIIPRLAADGYVHWRRPAGDTLDVPSIAKKIRVELGYA